MGTTNLQLALSRKLSRLKGERDAVRERIARTEKLVEALSDMRAHAAELDKLVEHASALMQHLNPEWSASDSRSIQPFVKQIPTRLGDCSRQAMDILRCSPEPMSARELALEILRREGFADASTEIQQRMTNTVLGALRSRLGTVVDRDGDYPKRWWVIRGLESHESR